MTIIDGKNEILLKKILKLATVFLQQFYVIIKKMGKELMTPKECGEYLRISLPSLYTMVHRHQIPVYHIGGKLKAGRWIGGRLRFDRQEIDKWLKEKRVCVYISPAVAKEP